MYSAIVLDEMSQLKLEKLAEDVRVAGVRVPILVRDNNWKVDRHHMIINNGELPNYLKQYLGTKQKLQATHIGVSPMAVAVRVNGFESRNKIPYVTLVVNIDAGGDPSMGSKITDWIPLKTPIKLSGTVEEVQ